VGLLLLALHACSKPAPPPEKDQAKDQATKPGLIFRGADGRELKAEDLDGATGKVKWEVVGAGAVPQEAHALHDQGRAAGSKSDWAKGGGPLPARSCRLPHVFRVALPKLAMKRLEAIGEESGPKQHHGLSTVL